MEDLTIPSNEENKYFEKYVKPYPILFYSIDDLINKDKTEDLICPICLLILRNPICCSDKINSHSFCKECIDQYLKENNKCPVCKLNFEYKIDNKLNDSLNKLSFECLFKKEGCKEILSYTEYLSHINNLVFLSHLN